MIGLIVSHLKSLSDVEDTVSPRLLVKNWIGNELWSTKAVRDAFFTSPQLPRLLRPDSIRDTIARGVSEGLFVYVSLAHDGSYQFWENTLTAADIDISDDLYILRAEAAQAYQARQVTSEPPLYEEIVTETRVLQEVAHPPSPIVKPMVPPLAPQTPEYERFIWEGEITSHQWSIFYQRALSRFATNKPLRIRLAIEIQPEEGISRQKAEEVKTALRELGVNGESYVK